MPKYKDCRYIKFKNDLQSDKHDFQVCNHNYLIANFSANGRKHNILMPHYQGIIVDEAHKLFTTYEQMHKKSFSENQIEKITELAQEIIFKEISYKSLVEKETKKLIAANKKLFKILIDGVANKDEDTRQFGTMLGKNAIEEISKILSSLNKLIDIFSNKNIYLTKNISKLPVLKILLYNACKEIYIFSKIKDSVFWLEDIENEKPTKLYGKPLTLKNIIIEDLWHKEFPVVLTSGTLSVRNSFQHIKKNTGLLEIENKLMETSKASTYNYKEKTLMYISENTDFPDNESENYIISISNEILKLIKATYGHTAVLFTSYKIMEKVRNVIEKQIPDYPIFSMSKDNLQALEQMKQSNNGVLLASGSIWEGVDLAGDILSSLIIVRLPFQFPDPLSEYESALYQSDSEYNEKVISPNMILKLKQGYGRLIRNETDTGIVAILDSRVNEKGNYRKKVLEALPECTVTSDISDVENFIKQNKNENYFL